MQFYGPKQKSDAKLVLEDGSVFYGYSFGTKKSVSGEVVFNTGMVGYPEAFTDPSYKGQILVLTYPLIGNYGVPKQEKDSFGIIKSFESDNIHISGLVISDYSKDYSHWNSNKALSEWLSKNNIPAICGIDTRELTKKLREKGVMLGKIIADDKDNDKLSFYDPNKENLVELVSLKKPVTFGYGTKHIALIDCGAKNNIIRSLLRRKLKLTVLPWDFDFFEAGLSFNGLFISNGPGDPRKCGKTIAIIRKAMQKAMPIMGICLGNQLLALAAGAKAYKLKYGHRSQNQPCIDKETGKCYITSQNHGYAIKTESLPAQWKLWFENANDMTNEGIKHKTKPFCSVQFHPEAMPGPTDTSFLFDEFKKML